MTLKVKPRARHTAHTRPSQGVLNSRFLGVTSANDIPVSRPAVIFPSDSSWVKASELSLSLSPVVLLLEICRRRAFPSSLPCRKMEQDERNRKQTNKNKLKFRRDYSYPQIRVQGTRLTKTEHD